MNLNTIKTNLVHLYGEGYERGYNDGYRDRQRENARGDVYVWGFNAGYKKAELDYREHAKDASLSRRRKPGSV